MIQTPPMLRMKPILCSGICILYFAALIAQVPIQKDKTTSNVFDQHIYQQKHCNIQQVLKVSVLFKYELDLHYSAYLTISPLSMISISFTECLIPPPSPDSTISEKLQSHLQTSLFYRDKFYFTGQTSCWGRSSRKYKTPIDYKFFFNYQ